MRKPARQAAQRRRAQLRPEPAPARQARRQATAAARLRLQDEGRWSADSSSTDSGSGDLGERLLCSSFQRTPRPFRFLSHSSYSGRHRQPIPGSRTCPIVQTNLRPVCRVSGGERQSGLRRPSPGAESPAGRPQIRIRKCGLPGQTCPVSMRRNHRRLRPNRMAETV